MSIGLFILILIAIWIVPKLIRGYMFVHRIRKQTRRMYEQMYNNGFGQGDTSGKKTSDNYSTQGSHSQRRRKKIDPSVGEYVSFEEISDTRTTSQSPHANYTIEQQVSDAEWEDITSEK
ncbi:MAG: DUF4834 family protein [Muribaculaceae bacterium]|nr:DUF4834 family protein [Muribaculaceae bacterium]